MIFKLAIMGLAILFIIGWAIALWVTRGNDSWIFSEYQNPDPSNAEFYRINRSVVIKVPSPAA